MATNSSEFFVTLPSNTHPNNKTGEFSVRLPNQLILNGRWEVGLTEILFPHSWDNLSTRIDTTDNMTDNQFFALLNNKFLLSCTIPAGYFSTVDELVEGINIAYSEAIDKISMHLNKSNGEAESEVFALDENGSSDQIIRFKNAVKFRYDRVYKKILVNYNQKIIKQLVLSKHLQYMLGFSEQFVMDSETMANYPTDLRGGLDTLYIYTNIVEPQIVGNTIVPLLRIVHIQGTHGEYIEKIFHSPHYIPVRTKEIDRIEIAVKSDSGIVIPFQFGKVICKLHFRKRRLVLE
jgi:hypothetical protein